MADDQHVTAALCTPCREGTPRPDCATCGALAAMVRAAVKQYFPDAQPGEVQFHMAGTPPWEREGWEAEMETEWECPHNGPNICDECAASDMYGEVE